MFMTRFLSAALAASTLPALAADLPPETQQLTTQGAYVARAGDCMACHAVRDSGKPYGGGYAIESPMGTIYSTNISPSKQYGIGNWTEEQFTRAVREGVAADGHNLYPAMPYPDYRNISDSDMHALYTYLMMQVAPVDEPPPHVTDLSFPFNLRLAMKGWNLLFLSKPDPSIGKAQTTEVYRGRYLVDTLGHCGSCHTPRNALMASDSSQYLAGGPLGGWHAPNITSDPVVGIGGWSVDELAGYLKNGHAAGRGQAAGGMAEAVEHSLSHLSDADLNAMAVYLKSVPAKSSPGQSKPAYGWGQTDTLHYEFDSESSRETLRDADMSSPYGTDGLTSRTYTFTEEKPSGARIYVNACASCHQPNGRGLEDQYYPSLSHNSTVGAENPNNLIMAVLKGIDRDSADGHTLMPGYENDLSNEQVAAVANYVMHRFGDPSAKPVTAEHVALLKAGGEKPLLARVSIWSKPAIAIAIVALLAIATLFWRKRRTRLSKLDPTL